MSRALLSFLGGMGSGYLSQTDKNKDRARQEKLDGQNQQLFDAKMDDINRAKTDRQALADAGKPATVEEGAGGMLKPQAMDNRDVGLPENADLPNQGLSDKAYRVAGASYATPAEAATAKTAYEAPDAVAARTVQALRSTGRAGEAMQMEAAVKSGKMNDLQLKAAQEQEARNAYNTHTLDAFRTHGVFGGAARVMSETNAMGQAGSQFEAVPSADGKTMQFFRTGTDGQRVLAHQVPNNKQGEMDILQMSLKLAPEKMVDWHQDALKRATDNERWNKSFARQGEQFGQTHGLAVNADTRQGNAAALQLKAGQLTYEKALEENKVPTAVKQQVEILRDELKVIATAQAKAQAEGLGAPDAPGAKMQAERQMVLNEKLHTLLTPYMPKANAAGAKPFGVPKGSAPAGEIPAMAPISYTDKVWGEAEPAAAKATGVPLRVLQSIRMQGERSNGDQVSPKGARGVYQFIPSSREAFFKKYGVDAYSQDPAEQALAAAYHLKESFDRTGDWNQAMAGFNGGISGEKGTNPTAENRNYAARTRIGGIPTTVPNPF